METEDEEVSKEISKILSRGLSPSEAVSSRSRFCFLTLMKVSLGLIEVH